MGESRSDADTLRHQLQQLLPAIQEAEKALNTERRRHGQLQEATIAAESVRDTLGEALQAPVCIAQIAANCALAEVAAMDQAAVNEVRALSAPPRPVVRTLELIHTLVFSSCSSTQALPKAPLSWAELQKILRRPDFLPRIKGFRVKGSLLENEALLGQLRRNYLGASQGSTTKDTGGHLPRAVTVASAPLTVELVRRASKAVALLFSWAVAQIELAELLQKAMLAKAGSESGADLSCQLSAAEASRERLAALASVEDLQECISSHSSLACPVKLVEAVHSADSGPQAVKALEAQWLAAEALLAELTKCKAAKELAVAAAKCRLAETHAANAALELELEAVLVTAQTTGTPFCACELEMVRRECTDLVSAHYGESCWRCPKGSRGCGQRIWDESRGNVHVPIGFKVG